MKVEIGHNVQVHYKGTFSDGTEFDNSWARERPLSFKVGDHRMISGFSTAVVGMKNGEKRNVTLAPEQAYGPHIAEATRSVPLGEFGDMKIEVGGMIRGNGPTGPFVARVTDVNEENATIDMNHPLAGKELNFEIELVTNYGTMPNTPSAPGSAPSVVAPPTTDSADSE